MRETIASLLQEVKSPALLELDATPDEVKPTLVSKVTGSNPGVLLPSYLDEINHQSAPLSSDSYTILIHVALFLCLYLYPVFLQLQSH